MALDRSLVTKVRRLDQYDLRRLMILARGLLLHADEVLVDQDAAGAGPGVPDEQATTVAGVDVGGRRVTYRLEHVRCGKAGCSTCPHGPYWYGYWKQDGRTRSQYVGRHLPGQPLEPVHPTAPSGSRSDGEPDGSTPA